MSNSSEIWSLCYARASESPFTLKNCFAALRNRLPVISRVRVRVTLWWHTQCLSQLGIAIIDAIMDGLQLMSIPLWLVTDQGRIEHVYPKRKKNKVSNMGRKKQAKQKRKAEKSKAKQEWKGQAKRSEREKVKERAIRRTKAEVGQSRG